jgi:hypothetical protein
VSSAPFAGEDVSYKWHLNPFRDSPDLVAFRLAESIVALQNGEWNESRRLAT